MLPRGAIMKSSTSFECTVMITIDKTVQDTGEQAQSSTCGDLRDTYNINPNPEDRVQNKR